MGHNNNTLVVSKMKALKYIIIVITYFNMSFANAQNIGYSNNDSNCIVFVKPIMFRYTLSQFKIDLNDTSRIVVKSGDSIIKRGENGNYRYLFDSPIVHIDVYRNQRDGLEKLCSSSFSTKELPINAYFTKKKFETSGGNVSVKDLNEGGLKATIFNYDIGIEYKVVSFKLAYTINDSLIVEKIEGSKLKDKQIDVLSKLKNRQPIVFKDILIEFRPDYYIPLDPVIYFFDKQ